MVHAAGALASEAVCAPNVIEASSDMSDDVGAAIQGSDCADLIFADADTKSIDAGAGDDVVIGASGVFTIDGGTGQDTIYVNGSNEATGGADDDQLFGDRVPELGTEAADPLEEALMPFVEEFGVEAVRDAVEQTGSELTREDESLGSETLMVSYSTLTTTLNGTGVADDLWGGSGNDTINGLAGNDRIFGNIGDDNLSGNADNDRISGGQGFDVIDGNQGNDTLRGDGTIDDIKDTGQNSSDTDTISFAGAVTPGFTTAIPNNRPGAPTAYQSFPGASGERGVYIDLTSRIADNGAASDGGGRDTPDPDINPQSLMGFENIIGSPYSDYIVGDTGNNVIDGGGGADVILGAGGNDTLYGNAGGDNIVGEGGTDDSDGGPGVDYCGSESQVSCGETGASVGAVTPRDTSKVAVGMISRPALPQKDFYFTGSSGDDDVVVTWTSGSPNAVRFSLVSGTFDSSPSEQTANGDSSFVNANPPRVTCESYDPIGAVIVSGMGGNDELIGPYSGMPRATTYISLGGDGNDLIEGTNTSDDLLVDGEGRDILAGFGQDDGLINNGGVDRLSLGAGDDLAISATICDSGLVGGVLTGDEIFGSTGSDNASWAQLPSSYNGVAARLADSEFGYRSSNGPTCAGSGGKLGLLNQIENLEGSASIDGLFGGGNDNTLLGRPGEDFLSGGAGADFMSARSDDDDTIDCGAGADNGRADPKPLDDSPAPVACESLPRG